MALMKMTWVDDQRGLDLDDSVDTGFDLENHDTWAGGTRGKRTCTARDVYDRLRPTMDISMTFMQSHQKPTVHQLTAGKIQKESFPFHLLCK